MDEEDEEDEEEFDPSIWVVSFDRETLRQPTNLELAEFIDNNNMLWFTVMKCLMLDSDLLTEKEELQAAIFEAKAAQKANLAWWSRLIKDEDEEEENDGGIHIDLLP